MLRICQYKGHLPVCYEEMDCPACEIIAELSRKQKRNAKGGKGKGFELICPVCGAKYPA